MYCPKCRAEFVEGIDFCSNCEVDLVAEAPDSDPFSSPKAMAEMLREKDLEAIAVGAYPNLREHQLALANEQIATLIAPEEGEEIGPGMHARLYLLAASEDLDAIRDYYQQRFEQGMVTEGLMLERAAELSAAPADLDAEGPGPGATACPACGEQVPAAAAECPECGLFLGATEEEE